MAKPTKATIDSIKNWVLDTKGDMEEAGYKGFKLIDHVEAGAQAHHTEHHIFKVPKRYALINIDDIVHKVVEKSGVVDGFIYIASMHPSSSVYVSATSQGLLLDIAHNFTDLAPYSTDAFQHNNPATNVDNGDAMIKNLLMGNSVTMPITKGQMDIGPDQYVYYAEFDGKKDKRVIIKVTGLKKTEGTTNGSEQKQGTQAVGGAAPAASGEKKPFRTYE